MPTSHVRTNNFLYAKGGWSLPICEESDPADPIAKNLSNIVLEQNVKSLSYSANYLEQDFYLPPDFARGVIRTNQLNSTNQEDVVSNIPYLTGAQIYLNADKGAVIKYRIYKYDNTVRQREITENNITGASGNGTHVTYTTELNHYLEKGDFITITGFNVNGFNGSFTIDEVTGAKTFKIKNSETGTVISKYGRITRPPREAKMVGNTWYIKYIFNKKYFVKYTYKIKKFDDKNRLIIADEKYIFSGPGDRVQKYLSKKLHGNPPPNQCFLVAPSSEIGSVCKNFEEWYARGGGRIARLTKQKINGKKGKKKDKYKYTFLVSNKLKYDQKDYDSFKKQVPLNRWITVEMRPDNFEIWVPWKPKKKIINVVESKTAARQELFFDNLADYREPLEPDNRYDCEFGWEGIIEGEVTAQNDGDQWIDIKFESLDLPTSALNQKFKLVIESKNSNPNINNFYYVAPSPLINKAQAFKSDGAPLSNGTAAAMIRILAATANDGVDFLSNEFRSSVKKLGVNNVNSNDDAFWSSKPNPSKYGVESLYFDVSDINNQAVRVDSIYLDTITPGVKFNVYYSVDDVAPGTDVDSWDQRLWKWVPKNYTAHSHKNYLFPNPIDAKYIKVEFTCLQAAYYDPGQHDRPILYKKYPSWVVNYFMSIYDMYHNTTEDPFIGSQTNLEYDLINLAYNYYKGDIITTTARPVVIDENNAFNLVPNLLKNAANDLSSYDQTSLTNINLSLDKFRKHPGYQSRSLDVVGRAATIKSINEYFNYSYEKLNLQAANTEVVSTTDRNHLLLEKSMPDMYFYPICRHGYMEAYAKFENKKAYFVKIKEIKFGRSIHNVISDELIYKFKPADIDNFEFSNFISTVNTTASKWSIT